MKMGSKFENNKCRNNFVISHTKTFAIFGALSAFNP